MNILVTGFGNFRDITENPSEILVRRLQQKYPDIRTFIFNGYKSIDDNLPPLLAEYNPDAILMFGLASKTPFVRLEQIANCPAKISGMKQYRSTLPLSKIHNSLANKNIEVQCSDSAGTYWCNYLFYKVCQLQNYVATSQHGFIHIPSLAAYEQKYKKELDLFKLGSTIMDSLAK